MVPHAPSPTDPLLRAARAVAAAATRWHRARCEGLETLPSGPALLVGNHGLYGLEVPVFFYLIHQATGRLPIGLADRVFFGRGPLCALLARCGGIPGTVDNARTLLRRGEWVVCYPGGSREVFKRPEDHYRLCWQRSAGFARLAIAEGAPIVPFAGLGVDDSYVNFGHLPGTRALFGRYAIPFAVGLGPLPLPVQFRFRLGAPITPPSEMSAADRLRDEVATRVMSLLADEQEAFDHEREDAQPEEAFDGAAMASAAVAVH